jgi:hypothetical protein
VRKLQEQGPRFARELRVSVYPLTWMLWPLYTRTWQRRYVYLGPIVIDWRVDE